MVCYCRSLYPSRCAPWRSGSCLLPRWPPDVRTLVILALCSSGLSPEFLIPVGPDCLRTVARVAGCSIFFAPTPLLPSPLDGWCRRSLRRIPRSVRCRCPCPFPVLALSLVVVLVAAESLLAAARALISTLPVFVLPEPRPSFPMLSPRPTS